MLPRTLLESRACGARHVCRLVTWDICPTNIKLAAPPLQSDKDLTGKTFKQCKALPSRCRVTWPVPSTSSKRGKTCDKKLTFTTCKWGKNAFGTKRRCQVEESMNLVSSAGKRALDAKRGKHAFGAKWKSALARTRNRAHENECLMLKVRENVRETSYHWLSCYLIYLLIGQ